jgi:hypothetical protein
METPCIADGPFDPTSHTPDVIIRSSDNVDFYVMKTFLAFSSPDVLGAMFTLPQSQQDISSPSGLHIIPITEDSEALRILLLHCYPLDLQDGASNVVAIARAMSAARKYVMDSVEKRLERTLFSNALPMLDDNSLHIYALACRYGLGELARAAAKKTLELPASYLSPSPELKHISGMDVFQLTQLRHRCVKDIWKWYFLSDIEHLFHEKHSYALLPTPYVWLNMESHKKKPLDQICAFVATDLPRMDDQDFCPVSTEDFYFFSPAWWSTYFVALMRAIEVCPSRRTIFNFSEEEYYKALTAASSYDICRPYAVRQLDAFREDFALALDEIVAKVRGHDLLLGKYCSSFSKAINELEFQKA